MARATKKRQLEVLLKEWNTVLGRVVDKYAASKHFMEGGKGVSCFVWATIEIKDKDTGKIKDRKIIVGSDATNCLNPTEAMYAEMKKLPRLETDSYLSALGYINVNLD